MYQSFDLQLPEGYENLNPNIINRVKSDLKNAKQFNYLFLGLVGAGKTYLAKIIYKQFYRLNHLENSSSFLLARDVYQEYLAVLNSNFVDKSTAIRKRLNCFKDSFSVLDDLGAETPNTDASKSYMADIIERRYEYWQENPKYIAGSIITSNLKTGQEIGEMYGHRLLDRLHEMYTIMIFTNHSFRNKKAEIIKG